VHQNSELANGWAQPYPSANLKIGRLSTSDNQSLLFPNPSIGSAQLQVSLLESSKISIQILDLTGRLIQIINQQRSAGVHVLDLPNMAAGQYLVRMNLDSEHSSATEIHRWVVQP
jgi:hypothetical protein